MNRKFKVKKISAVVLGLVQVSAILMAGMSTSAQAGPTIPFNDQSYLTISYDVQMEAQQRGFTSPTNSSTSSDFFLRRNRLVFNGQVNDYVGFFAQFEGGSAKTYGLNGNTDQSIFYRDAYVTLDYTDPVRFVAGRFKNVFTRENLEGCFDPLTLDRAQWLAYTPWGGSRDTGIAMWGNLVDGKFQYKMMVSNGRDDTNAPKKSPRYTARAHWSFFDPEADFGYVGTYLGTKKVLTIGVAQDYQADVVYSNFLTKTNPLNYSASTADFFYEQPFSSGTYTLSGAIMRYKTGNAINAPAANVDPLLPQTSELGGGYMKAAYMLPNKIGIGRLQFFGRSERSKYHLITGYGDQKWNGIGANYYIDGQKLKLTGEFAQVKFDVQNPTDPTQRDYSQATMALQFLF